MAIKIEVNTSMAFDYLLRDDIVKNLGWEGIEAIIEHYNELCGDVEYDPSLFWEWCRYDSAKEACEDLGIEVDKEDFDGEPYDEKAYEEECRKELEYTHSVIELSDSILVRD